MQTILPWEKNRTLHKKREGCGTQKIWNQRLRDPALHAEAVRCKVSVSWNAKTEIPD